MKWGKMCLALAKKVKGEGEEGRRRVGRVAGKTFFRARVFRELGL